MSISFSKNKANLFPKLESTLYTPTHNITKHTQTIRRLLPKKCLSVFDDFVGLALKGLSQ